MSECVECDICVVGAGMVGAATALQAARQGWRVVMWERQAPVQMAHRLGMGIRTVALSPASLALLASLDIVPVGASMTAMHVWEELGTATLRFDAGDLQLPELGRIVENDVLVAALWRHLTNEAGIEVRLAPEIETLQAESERVILRGDDLAVAARLVIAADGGRSRVRTLLGGETRRWQTGHAALATVVSTTRPHAGVAHQRFLREGPVALLPGTQPNLAAVVWSQPPAQAQARRTLDDTAFCTALTRATESVLGVITACDERLVFPLVQHLADEAVPHPRIALVGDALRVLHPLAGMGVNLGFEDVSGLGRALEGGGDPGASGRLEAFARRRQVRSRTLVELMAGFRDVYAWETPGRTWLRNAGIRLVDSLPALKRQIMREALGLGPVARAMR